MSKRFTGMTS